MKKFLLAVILSILTFTSACTSIDGSHISKYEGMKLDKALYQSLQNEDWSGMAELAQMAIKYNEKDDLGYLFMGISEHEYERYDSALKYYDKALELAQGTKKSDIYQNRGYTYYKLGKKDLAIKDYEKAIELNPNSNILKEQLEYIKGETNYLRVK